MNTALLSPAIDRTLIGQVKDRVGDRLISWVEERRRTASDPSSDTRKQYAARLTRDELEQINQRRLASGRPLLTDAEFDLLMREVLASLFGAGGFQRYLDNPRITNIHFNGADSGFATFVDGTRANLPSIADSDADMVDLVRQLISTQGRSAFLFDPAHPMVSFVLPNGIRITGTMGVSDRVAVSIRRPAITEVTLDKLVELGTVSPLGADFCSALIVSGRNIVTGGGTDSGKTTFLRALAGEIPRSERVVTVEDASELRLKCDRLPNVVSLEARPANIEGTGEVSLAALMPQTLRMSPDRVIVGEVRGSEVVQMLLAMTSGHNGSLCTVHAESAEGIFARLRLYVMMGAERYSADVANQMISQAVHFSIHLRKGSNGVRKVTAIEEVAGVDERGNLHSNEVFALARDGVLRATGTISDHHRRVLEEVGFDSSRLVQGAA